MPKKENSGWELAPVDDYPERPVDEFAKTEEEQIAALRRTAPDQIPDYGEDTYRPPVEGPESIELRRELKRQMWEEQEKQALKQVKAEMKEQQEQQAATEG